jgi:hypothetical protein
MAYDRQHKELQYVPTPSTVEAFGYDSRTDQIITASKRYCRRNPVDLSIETCHALPVEIIQRSTATDAHVTASGEHWVAGWGGIARLTRSEDFEIYTQKRDSFPFRAAITLEEDPRGQLWAGCSDGLARFQDNQWHPIRPDWIKGNINQLLILESGLSVAVSPISIFVFQIRGDSIQPLHTYTHNNGYGPTEPSESGLFYDKHLHRVWIPTIDGVYRLNLSDIPKPSSKPRLSVIGVNDQLSSIKKNNQPIPGTFAEITLSMVDPNHQKWLIRYQVNDDEMSPLIDDFKFLVSNLEHGENTITLQAVRPENPDQFVQTELTLFARLPLLKRPTFIWGLLASIVALLALLAAGAVRDYRRNQRLQKLELELQFNRLRTLEAYFNPHFIFNTLTAIQNQILQRNKEKGNELIVKLSRIFRYALKVDPGFMRSNKTLNSPGGVPLSEELKLIRDYVFLQQAQEHQQIEYIEEIAPEALTQDINIPKLLIQPFVENIFKHAFPHRKGKDQIVLRVEVQEPQLRITLTDNGRGLQDAEIEPERQSLGKKLALERMNILKNMSIKNDITVTHHSKGTRVQINIDYESYSH